MPLLEPEAKNTVSPESPPDHSSRLQTVLPEPQVRFVRGSIIVASSITLLAIAYVMALGGILNSVRGFYHIETWRQGLLNDRLVGYRTFFLALAAASWIFTLVLRYSAVLKFPIVLVGIGVAIGVRLSYNLWRSYDSPCWDGYCRYASYIRAWLIDRSVSNHGTLMWWMRRDYHSNSPVGPAFMAVASVVTGRSVEQSYGMMSGLATLGTLAFSSFLPTRRLFEPLFSFRPMPWSCSGTRQSSVLG